MPLNELRIAWGANLRRARVACGLSLAALSKDSGVDRGHLSRVENGLAGLSDEYRATVAARLGVRVEDIWTYPVAS